MKNIQDVADDVEAESSIEDGLIVLTTSLKASVDAALAGTVLPTAVQAKIDSAFAALETNKAKLAAAIVANTPAAS